VPSGTLEVLRLQAAGYGYFRPESSAGRRGVHGAKVRAASANESFRNGACVALRPGDGRRVNAASSTLPTDYGADSPSSRS
jgi:hypothetical protein